MPVRNYPNPDPKAVLRNIADVLANQDMGRLQRPAYQILITHCGFIAHYDLNGFKAEYRDRLDDFVEFFLQGGEVGLIDGITGMPIDQWQVNLDNPRSYLYDVSYRGVMLHEIVRDLLALFQRYRQGIEWGAEAKRKVQKLAVLNRLADELGYICVPKEVTHAQET